MCTSSQRNVNGTNNSVLIYQFPNKARFISWCTLILGFEIYAVIVEAQSVSKSE